MIASQPLAPHAAYQRSELQARYAKFEAEIEKLNQRVEEQACGRVGPQLLMTGPGVEPVAIRCCGFSGVRRRRTPYVGTRSCSVFTAAN
jgi:hypothetical protein